MRNDTVLDIDSRVVFSGRTDETVEWLERAVLLDPFWVSIGDTGDLLTSSEYLDLAS